MANELTEKLAQDMATDIVSFDELVNGGEAKQVTTRKGETYPSVKKAIKTLFENGGLPATPFATKALMTASSLANDKYAMVTNDTITVNNGLYVKTAGAWVKSTYDPLTQAKNYTDSNAVLSSNLQYEYGEGNLVGDLHKTYKNKGLDQYLEFVGVTSFDISSIPVTEGDLLIVMNESQSYRAASGEGHAFYSKTLDTATDLDRIDGIEVEKTDLVSGIKYLEVRVPVGAKILAFNTRFNTPRVWNIQKGKFNSSYANGSVVVSGIGGNDISNVTPDYVFSSLRVQRDGNLFDKNKDVVYTAHLDSYNPPKFDANNYRPDWGVGIVSIKKGFKYYLKILGSIAFPFQLAISEVEAEKLLHRGSSGVLVKPTLTLVNSVNGIYEVTIPDSIDDPKSLLFNAVITPDFNIVDTVEVYQGWVAGSNKSVPAYDSINGISLIDIEARKLLAKQESALLKPDGSGYVGYSLRNKRVATFGDSITQGTQGGYQPYLVSELGCIVDNYGVSGHHSHWTGDVVRGVGTYPVIDFTKVDVVTIMIGTNDRGYGAEHWDSMSAIPAGNIYENVIAGTVDSYWASFPKRFAPNIGICIEYIRWKNPRCKIYIVSPPVTGVANDVLLEGLQYYKAIADYYSVGYINATQESGLGLKDIGIWSYDNLHLNTLGNEIFGKFLAKRIANG